MSGAGTDHAGVRRGRRPPRFASVLAALALGALCLPGAVLPLAGILSGAATSSRNPFALLYTAHAEARRAVGPGVDGRLAARPGWTPPARFDLVVADEAGRVVASSLPEVPAGTALDDVALASFGALLAPGRSTASGSFSAAGVGGTFYLFAEPDPAAAGRDPIRPLRLAALLFGIGLFVVLCAATIAAFFSAQVTRLERAAVRIASGDLETAVAARGTRELIDLADAMERMRRAIREDRDRRSRFLAGVSHDLRTPLTAIGGYLEAIQDGLAEDPETLGRYVGIARDRVELLGARIAGLIDFARMDTDEWRRGFAEIPADEWIAGLARGFEEDAAFAGLGFRAELAGAAGARILADRALLGRALENLVANALRFSPAGGTVRLGATVEGGRLLLIVDDEGPGIPPAERELVFEPYHRGSGAREGEGSGLGLHIARSIARGHGGGLRALDAPGGGGRLVLDLPAMQRGGAGAPDRA